MNPSTTICKGKTWRHIAIATFTFVTRNTLYAISASTPTHECKYALYNVNMRITFVNIFLFIQYGLTNNDYRGTTTQSLVVCSKFFFSHTLYSPPNTTTNILCTKNI